MESRNVDALNGFVVLGQHMAGGGGLPNVAAAEDGAVLAPDGGKLTPPDAEDSEAIAQ